MRPLTITRNSPTVTYFPRLSRAYVVNALGVERLGEFERTNIRRILRCPQPRRFDINPSAEFSKREEDLTVRAKKPSCNG